MKKRLISLILVICLAFALLTMASAANVAPFTDVDSEDWYAGAVKAMYEGEIMLGTSDTTFSPMDDLSRGMVVTVLYRLCGASETVYNGAFSDVADGKWYSDAVSWASENAIVKGYPDGTFAPNKLVTRQELATILYRFCAYIGGDAADTAPIPDTYTDADSIGSWAEDAMAWAIHVGLIQGMSDAQLDPNGTANRAQCAVLLQRFMALYGNAL